MLVTEITYLEKGKVQVSFDSAEPVILYRGELRRYFLEEQTEIPDEVYEEIYYGIVGKRVKKRAMYLLERMDRTEEQLRRKLIEGKYPKELIEQAIDYVKSYHYIDDDRYARTFIRLNQSRRSSGRMKLDLLSRGVAEDIIELALEEENETDQEGLIRALLEKKQYDPENAAPQDKKKMYQFLMRRGFAGSEVMHVLRWP